MRRIDFEGGWYHVMNRGADRQTTFFSDADRIEFGRLLATGHERFGVEVHAYCLMTNHYHLVLHCPQAGLSDFMHNLGSVFTRHANIGVGRDGPLFRGRFHSIVVRHDEQLVNTIRYVHRNALDLPGVDNVDTYRWSSHRTYLGHRALPEWMRTDTVLARFDNDRGRFHQFVSDQPRSCRDINVDALPSITNLVIDERFRGVSRSRQGLARTVLILILARLPIGTMRNDLARTLDFAHQESQKAAIRRARRRALSDSGVDALVDRVLELAA